MIHLFCRSSPLQIFSMFKGFGKDDHKKEEGEKEKGFSFSFGKKDASPPKPRGPNVSELQEQIESMQEQMSMLSQERRKEVTFAQCCDSSFICENWRMSCCLLTHVILGNSNPRIGKRACKLQGCTRGCHLLRRRRRRLAGYVPPALSGKPLLPHPDALPLIPCHRYRILTS